MKRFNLNQSQLGRQMDVPQSSVSNWVNGNREMSKSTQRLLTLFFKEKTEREKK